MNIFLLTRYSYVSGLQDMSKLPRTSQPDFTLQAIQFTCIHLAAKIVDQIPACDVLRYMLSKVRRGRRPFLHLD